MKSLSIILPAYNEAERLPRTFELLRLAKAAGIFRSMNLEAIWVIDDGSKDNTAALSEAARASLPEIKVHSVIPNQGKGNAIHVGLKLSQSEWCLIADADSATPWDQFSKLRDACISGDQNLAAIAMGSRDLPESKRNLRQSAIRENLGRLFNFAVRLVTQLPFKDTQCGFKLIHKPSIEKILPLLEVKRFAWDVELLMFAQTAKLKMLEVPVDWEHQDGSRISPLKDGIEMFLRVIQMRFRIWFNPIQS
jgi:glycosyltransferase involved in cell wall biosynthesis